VNKRLLVLAAHPDDEIGCAGTIIRLIDNGWTVSYVALSGCEDSIDPTDYPITIRRTEAVECMKRLGVYEVAVMHYPVRKFDSHRQDILQTLIDLRARIKPDMVMVPCSYDRHQDHAVVSAEGFRAFKHTKLLGYMLPQNLRVLDASMFVELSQEILDRKCFALKAHKSQSDRPYFRQSLLVGFAETCGLQAGLKYAEAFEAIRDIWGIDAEL